MLIAGNKIYEYCEDCEKLVQINKMLIGSMHICLTEEEKAYKVECRAMVKAQSDYIRNPSGNALGGAFDSYPNKIAFRKE